MPSRFLRALIALDLEERILNAGAVLALLGLFFPWISGEWIGGDAVSYSGFGFYTSFLGLAIFLLEAYILAIALLPMAGGPVLVRKRNRDWIRLVTSALASVLAISSLSVLTKVTFEFSRMEVRFGIYCTVFGSLLTLLYAFLRYQEFRKAQAHELFLHPEERGLPAEREESTLPPPPPPPPPPPAAEEHRLYP